MQFLYVLESIRTPVLDAFFSLITHAGEESLFILFGLLMFWCVSKKEGYFLLCVGLTGTVINQFLKLAFRIPRPWVRDPAFTIVESARAEATGYSFPSGHTQVSVGVYGAMGRAFPNKLFRAASVSLCVLVPLSRMYLGVHTPADVGVSIAIALALIFLLYPITRQSDKNPFAMRALFAAMALGALGLLLFAQLYPFPADTDVSNLQNGISSAWKMLGCILGLALSYEIDIRYIRFETKAALSAQILKLSIGFVLLTLVRSGLKAPLRAVMSAGLADGMRYFLMVIFAGCIWPLSFRFFARLANKA